MSSSPSRSTRLAATVPAMAAVLVSAMLISMAMATGTAPRLASSVAVHAMLLGASGQSRETTVTDDRPVTAFGAAPDRPATGRPALRGDHEATLASRASAPGRGDLPPPVRG